MATTSLAGWMKYLSGPVPGAPDADAQDFLRRLQQYDPSAHIEAATGGGDAPGAAGYRIVYDQAKLPKPTTADALQGDMPLTSSGAREVTATLNKGLIVDQSQIHNDPVYGQWASSGNIREPKTAVDRWGPVAVGGVAGAGALGLLGPGAASAGSGLTLGDMGGSFGGQFGTDAAGGLSGSLGDIGPGGGGLGEGGYSPDTPYGNTFNPDGTIPQGTPGFDQAGAPVSPGGPGDNIGDILPSDAGQSIRDVGAPASDASMTTGPGIAAGSLGGAAGGVSTIGDLLKALGGGSGLLNLLGPIAGALLTKNATSKATDQVLAGIDRARTDATSLLGNNQALYKPYMDAGPTGIDAMTKMLRQPGLAGNFKPIANQSLAQNYRPLGAGRALAAPQITLGQMMGRR